MFKLVAGQYDYPMPQDFSHAHELVIFPDGDPRMNPGSIGQRLPAMFESKMVRLLADAGDDQARGTPNKWCTMETVRGDRLLVHPVPDRDIWASLKYWPAMREL